MKKIISLFQRNYDGDRLVRDEVTEGAEWVIAGEGVATRKFDGTCCLIRGGRLFKRYEVKQVGARPLPLEFEPAGEIDRVTGKIQGWVPVGDGPEDRWHRESFAACMADYANAGFPLPKEATYELVGPKIQGNPEMWPFHRLVRHGAFVLGDAPRTFAEIREYLAMTPIEGIVWHHEDGRLVKIKAKDFGLKRFNG